MLRLAVFSNCHFRHPLYHSMQRCPAIGSPGAYPYIQVQNESDTYNFVLLSSICGLFAFVIPEALETDK